MTETMLDRIAKAWETYGYSSIKRPVVVLDRNNNTVAEFDEITEAADACKRMNARAVLEVLMEPTKEMLMASGFAKTNKARWQAMLAEIPKE